MKKLATAMVMIMLIGGSGFSLLPGQNIRTRIDQILQNPSLEAQVMNIDNQKGSIAWAKVFYMEALLNMYEITGETAYLNHFLRHARDLMRQENKFAGRLDFDGKLRRGWQTNYAYTFSKPVLLRDGTGRAVLRLQGKRWGQNNFTQVRVTVTEGDRIAFHVTNRAAGYKQTLGPFSLAELKRWAPSTDHMSRFLTVTVLGDRLPASDTVLTFQSEPVTLTTFHNGRILVPLLRFVDLVRSNALPAFQASSDSIFQFCQEVFAAYDSLWQPQGYYINEPGIPFAYAGLPVPYNILADHGRSFIYFYRLTGDHRFLQRIAQITLRIFLEFRREDGKWIFHYAFGPLFDGWKEGDSHRYAYPRFEGARRMEDISHFKSTVIYVYELLRHDMGYFNGLRNTIIQVLDQVFQANRFAYYLDGSGNRIVSDAAGTFVLLFPYQPAVQKTYL
ncbi:MAG: hypothetical protein D6715_02485, partial [Calditrichaeota bacterium]